MTTCVTRRSTTTLAKRERFAAREPVLALEQVQHPVDGDPRRPAEVLVEAEREPGAVDPRDRPLERQVVAHVERDLRLDRRLDRRARDLAVALRRVPVAGGEERAVDRDRQEERRAGDELLAVDVPAAAPRRPRRVDARLGRRHPEHAEERRQPHGRARRAARCRPSSSQSSGAPSPPNVTPHEPGDDVVDAHDERLPGPRAAHLDRPGERVAGVELRVARRERLVATEPQPAFGVEKRTESPGSTVSTGSRSREK